MSWSGITMARLVVIFVIKMGKVLKEENVQGTKYTTSGGIIILSTVTLIVSKS